MTATHSIAITSKSNQIIPVDIGVEEAKRLIGSEEVILLDVRAEEEYDAAHIDGALLVPLSELGNKTKELNTSEKIVVYSANGSNSSIACGMLIKNGSKRVYNVLGGLNAWNKSGYAVVPTETSILEEPGFEAALALVALLVVACWVRRKKVLRK